MHVQPFADLLKQWIVAADHPGISRVLTCAEVGLWEVPVGVRVTLRDGWSFVFQTVGGSAVGASTPADEPAKEFWTPWAQRPDYIAARKVAETAAAQVQPAAKNAKPGLRVGEVMALLIDSTKRADDPRLSRVEVTKRGSLQVTFINGLLAWTYPVGVMPPGAFKFVHPLHQIPEEYR